MKRLHSGSLVLLIVLSTMAVGTVQAKPQAQERDRIIFSTLTSPTDIIGHPWAELVEEYNAANPHVEVEILAGATWDSLGTMILAGNPPDLMQVSMAGIFSLVPQMPYAVDVSPYLTPEDIEDFGPLFDNLRHPANPEHILGFPVEMRPEPEICANVALFEEAGIDWMKIRQQGWTWDEFIAAAQLLTVDEAGLHPNEEGFDDDNVATWGWGSIRDGTAWALSLAMMNNGVAQSTPPQFANVGGVWDVQGPQAVEAAQWIQDWMYEYRITDPAFRAWGDPQWLQMFQYHIEGKTAMHAWGGATCAGAVDMYNQAVESGEVAGSQLDARLWSLPHPYNPANMPHEVYSVRPIYLQMMRQEPYQGDEHTQNVADFAKWFISTETQIRLCTELSTAPCPLPARETVREVVLTDPQLKADIDYMIARAKPIPQLSHPALAEISTQIWTPNVDRLFAEDIDGQTFVDDVASDAQPMLDDWTNGASAEDVALVELWCKIPSWFPGAFYPNYTPTVSAPCQAKLQELGIQ